MMMSDKKVESGIFAPLWGGTKREHVQRREKKARAQPAPIGRLGAGVAVRKGGSSSRCCGGGTQERERVAKLLGEWAVQKAEN